MTVNNKELQLIWLGMKGMPLKNLLFFLAVTSSGDNRTVANKFPGFLFTSVAVPLCLPTDRLKFFVNNYLTDTQSGVLLAIRLLQY